ncbi:ABC transporter substrate-binding protein [Sphaerimonospora sp. CA-214678]|uniref:ABC transporter substrate-binding protein n=1 Tax=Sphaerimonospora sp. CA-214678 TaxID=3240029 RepID=UPI003D8A6C2C
MFKRISALIAVGATALTLAACGGGSVSDENAITLGFSQVGAESDWRTANTQSIHDSAQNWGVELHFAEGDQKQETQIEAMRSFIEQKVDVIAFSPVIESGWDEVLKEARDANIPVILTDRAIDSADKTLYRTFLGSDFVEEGRKAGRWLAEEFAGSGGPVNIVELQGTIGSAPATDRKAGFQEIISADAKFKIVESRTANFTRAEGKEVMEAILRDHRDIDVLFAHNDDMGIGAIEAIENAGKVPGKDIKIVTVDAIRDGMQALADGKINFIVECSPLLGPQLMDLAQRIVRGERVPARVVTEETTFTREQAEEVLSTRQY